MRNALRSYSIDRIRSAVELDMAAANVATAELDALFGSAYGIFSGKANKLAVLRFTPEHEKFTVGRSASGNGNVRVWRLFTY